MVFYRYECCMTVVCCIQTWQWRPSRLHERTCPASAAMYVDVRPCLAWSHRRLWSISTKTRHRHIDSGLHGCTRTRHMYEMISTRYNQICLLHLKVKVKEAHTPKECRRGAHLSYTGHWARRWINHYCLWRMASTTPDLRLPSQPKLVLMRLPTKGWPGWVDLGGWLHTEIVYPPEDGHPSRH